MRKLWQVTFRMANRLQAVITKHAPRPPEMADLSEALLHCQQQARRLSRLDPFRRPVGFDRTHAQLTSQLQSFLVLVEQTRTVCERASPPTLPSVTQIALDLVGIQEEFAACELDLKGNRLVVTTETIELEGFSLGAFTIQLDLVSWSQALPIRIESVDDTSAASNPDVCHPHVLNGSLCLGDGQVAAESALRTGRIHDLMLVLRQVLETYNDDSAYVRLEDWDGVNCPECGDLVHEDNRAYCDNCQAQSCEHCTFLCYQCDDSFCNECLETCPQCDNSFCRHCLSVCTTCDEGYCESCLDEDHQTCDRCTAEKEEEQIEEEKTESPEGEEVPLVVPTAVHTDRVGQAGLPA